MSNFNLAVNTHTDPRREAPMQVGTARQLLVDDFLLAMGRGYEQYPRNIEWRVGSVQKHGAPLMAAQPQWEASVAWLSVLNDGGKYRMWYNSGHDEHKGLVLSYADSDDGVSFERRKLGLVDFKGSTDNNLVFDGGLAGVSPEVGNVFVDPNALDGERYKLIYSDWWSSEQEHYPFTHNVGMLRGAASPDGLHWSRYYDNFLGKYCDSQNSVCWDEDLGRYVAYHRDTTRSAGLQVGGYDVRSQHRGRAVGRLESYDFRNWTSTGFALEADFADTLDTDIYNSGYSRYPHAPHMHFMFPSFYRHYEGTFDAQVCTSRDNRTWFRATRETFIPRGEPGEFDCFIVSVAPGFVVVDDDTLALYYRAGNGPHGGSKPIELDDTPESRVSRVTLKRDRVIGIEAGGERGQFVTRQLDADGSRLLLNFEPLDDDASLAVQLVDAAWEPIAGYTFDEFDEIREDELDGVARWRGNDRLPAQVAAGSVAVHIRLTGGRLYAFQFAD